jgi:hypothetical protein
MLTAYPLFILIKGLIKNNMSKLKFKPAYDNDGNIRSVIVYKICPECGESTVVNILTDGSDEELEDYIWDNGYRDYIVEEYAPDRE